MNKERLLQLADAIEHGLPRVAFGMGAWNSDAVLVPVPKGCDSICCIGGHTELLYSPNVLHNGTERTGGLLGLDYDTANNLFYPQSGRAPGYGAVLQATDYTRTPWDATPIEAARVIRHLANTGELDWSVML